MVFFQHPILNTATLIHSLESSEATGCQRFNSKATSRFLASCVLPVMLGCELIFKRPYEYIKGSYLEDSQLQSESLSSIKKLALGLFKSSYSLFDPRHAALDFLPKRPKLEAGLERWVQAAAPGENRALAKVRILECLDSLDEDLDLGSLNLTSLPLELFELKHLENLNLRHNLLQKIPQEIRQLETLQELYVCRNQLRTLPEELADLSSLKTLYAEHNLLETLPSKIDQLLQLKELNLKNNNLAKLPDSFCGLRRLKSLYLDHNQLRALPLNFGHLADLTALYLDFNPVNELPESFQYLDNLAHLYMKDNQLESLPDWFGELRSLNFIRVNGDQIRELEQLTFAPRGSRELFFMPLSQEGVNSFMRRINIRVFSNAPTFIDLDNPSSLSVHDEDGSYELGPLDDLMNPFYELANQNPQPSSFWEDLKDNLELKTFVSRQTDTAWFMKGTKRQKRNLSKRFTYLMEKLVTDKDFGERGLLEIHHALSSCADRVSYGLDKLSSAYILTRLSVSKQKKASAAFLIRQARLDMIDLEAAKLAGDDESDALEIAFVLQLKLKKNLKLPLLSTHMLYERVARIQATQIESIGCQILSTTRLESDVAKILAQHDVWQKALREENEDIYSALLSADYWDIRERLEAQYLEDTKLWLSTHYDSLKQSI